MNQETLYRDVQSLFVRGVVTLIGSGASCARGLPSMGQLATHLESSISRELLEEDDWQAWQPIAAQLALGDGLESALDARYVPDAVMELIVQECAACVARAEADAFDALLAGETESVLGPLLQMLLVNNSCPEVVTTNYDRLIEVDAALQGIRVDTMFYGQTLGRLDARLARDELLFLSRVPGRGRARKETSHRPHIRLAKPHGSLDWRLHNGSVVRTDLAITASPMIITPGSSKYREGYEVPFDGQRERANHAIDNASALLTIGYGFNDPHLQTHLKRKFKEVPALVLAYQLTDSAQEYLSTNERAIGIESASDSGRSLVHQAGNQLELDGDLWKIEELIREVLS